MELDIGEEKMVRNAAGQSFFFFFFIISHLQIGLFPQNNRCIMCRIQLLFEKWKLSLIAEEVHRVSRALGSRLPKEQQDRDFVRGVFNGDLSRGRMCSV